jgi:hypothetical protein
VKTIRVQAHLLRSILCTLTDRVGKDIVQSLLAQPEA